MAGRRTDIGSGRVYCDLKFDLIEIRFGCLKTDPTRKIGSVIGSVFQVSGRVLGWTFFFCCCCLLNGKGKGCYWVISSLVQLLDTLFDCLDFPILVLDRFFWMNLLIHQKINKSFLGFKISIVLSKLATTKNEIYI